MWVPQNFPVPRAPPGKVRRSSADNAFDCTLFCEGWVCMFVWTKGALDAPRFLPAVCCAELSGGGPVSLLSPHPVSFPVFASHCLCPFYLFYHCMFVYDMGMGCGAWATEPVWKSDDNLCNRYSPSTFDSGDQTQLTRFWEQAPLPTGPSCWLIMPVFIFTDGPVLGFSLWLTSSSPAPSFEELLF